MLQRLPDDGGPSCVLLHIRIPGLSGPDVQDRLSALGSHLPIGFLTGHADIRTVMKAGADDLSDQAGHKDELIGAIERAIAQGQAWREKNDQLTSLQKLVDSLTPCERQVLSASPEEG